MSLYTKGRIYLQLLPNDLIREILYYVRPLDIIRLYNTSSVPGILLELHSSMTEKFWKNKIYCDYTISPDNPIYEHKPYKKYSPQKIYVLITYATIYDPQVLWTVDSDDSPMHFNYIGTDTSFIYNLTEFLFTFGRTFLPHFVIINNDKAAIDAYLSRPKHGVELLKLVKFLPNTNNVLGYIYQNYPAYHNAIKYL